MVANMDSSEMLSDGLDPKKEDDEKLYSSTDKSCLNATNVGNSLKSSCDLVDKCSTRKRKRKGHGKMLNWLLNVAKDTSNSQFGELPEFSRWNKYGDDKPWKQVLIARDMMCVKRYPNSLKEFYASRNVRGSPRKSKKQSKGYPCKRTLFKKGAPSESSSCTRSDVEDDLGKKSQSFSAGSEFYFLRDRDPSKRVPVGPNHQTHIPNWTKEIYECDSRMLGSRVWPPESRERRKQLVEKERMGKGRQESCGCPNQGSVQCVRFHVSEKKTRVNLELGSAYSSWEFNKMGEEVALSWTKEEEKKFQEIIRSNPPSLGVLFWDKIIEAFPSKNREELVSYFFNVFLLRRRSYQNRSTPNKIDTDDEDSEFGSLSDGFKNETGKSPSSIFYSPKKLQLSS